MKKICAFLLSVTILMLCAAPAAMASWYAPMDASTEELAAANLFLSNFTEVGVKRIEEYYADHTELVDFAHDHIWFNDNDAYEFGEYAGENNCRVSDDDIQRIVDRYFYDAPKVDLTQTRFDYEDGYYYHCETGGWTPNGFAHVVSLCPIGESKYFASFMVFGGGEAWDNSVMDDTLDEVEAQFGHPNGYGAAIVFAENLSDRSTYKMISYSLV